MFDVNAQGDNIGSIIGAGVVTNHTQALQFWLNGATRTFSGRCYGTGSFAFLQPGTFVVGASNSLENVTFDMTYPGLLLAFAPEIGTFTLGGLINTNSLVLQDTLGGAITLGLGGRNDSITCAHQGPAMSC